MANLITITDIQAIIKDMSINVEQERIERYIAEAQEFDLKPILGRALYLAFVNGLAASPQEQIYVDLWEGKTYLEKGINADISFAGVKQALIYYAYARFLNNQNTNVGSFGIVVKENNPYSKPEEEKRIQRLVTAAIQAAESYKVDFVKFLNDNSTDYPLWLKEDTTSNAVKGGIHISRVTRGGLSRRAGKIWCGKCGRHIMYCNC